MLHVPFRHQTELLGNYTTFTAAYVELFQSHWKTTSTDFNSRATRSINVDLYTHVHAILLPLQEPSDQQSSQ